ncbi:biopolymer transporter ExbD [Bacteroidia bacterium]|nr:biopolymer transporter ExbD [Bacteroidia bacterium]
MLHRKRKIPQINSSSMADIAFLLLIFFLITSSFDSKTGIYRKMNVPEIENALKKRMDIQDRNLLVFTITADNQILYQDEVVSLEKIRPLSMVFIDNPDNAGFLPEKTVVAVPEAGEVAVTSQHVISLKFDRKADYQTYLSVLSELIAAYNDLRREAAHKLLHRSFERLTGEQKEAMRTIYPYRISETELKEDEK